MIMRIIYTCYTQARGVIYISYNKSTPYLIIHMVHIAHYKDSARLKQNRKLAFKFFHFFIDILYLFNQKNRKKRCLTLIHNGNLSYSRVTRNTSPIFFNVILGVRSCLLQCKIPADILLLNVY